MPDSRSQRAADKTRRTRNSRQKRRQTNHPFTAYLVHHLRVFIASLGHLSRHPAPTLMTSAVIAIALALPAGLYVSLGNIGKLGQDWDNSAQISLFLQTSATLKQAEALAQKLRLHKHIRTVDIIDKEQGFAQFSEHSGFGDALKFLDENPLPIVLSVQPVVDPQQPGRLNQLLDEMRDIKLVELAQLDLQWVKRLYAILEIAQRGIWVIGSLLALAVLLIVGNTIRLDIQNHRSEIEVAKLIGASNAFIRRPFLYTGLWYGLLGGLLAWFLTALSLWLLAAPVERLSSLYQSDFQLSGLDLENILTLLAISCSLGLTGSWLAVGKHLDAIEPS